MQSSHLKNKDIIAATDECVMCGLCLPHCPTYSITKNEAESPRGRIALVRALHESELLPSPVLIDHLDQCVACMNCVSVCPVNIEYAKILDAGRDTTNKQHALLHRMKQTLLLATLSKASMRRFVKFLLLIYHALRIDSIFRILAARFPNRLRILSLIPRPDKARFPSRPLLGTYARFASRVSRIMCRKHFFRLCTSGSKSSFTGTGFRNYTFATDPLLRCLAPT